MEKLVFKDYSELSVQTAKKIADIINAKPGALLCFPAGETSTGTFEELIRMTSAGEVSFSNCKIAGLDEWVKMGSMEKENCYNFLKSSLFDYLDIRKDNFCFFNGESDDLASECLKTDEFIKANGGIDMMLLGVGMNGHIGLNEPGISFDKYSHITELDEVTKKVCQKYFSKPVNLTHGITLGMKHVMEAKTVIVQLSGKKKASVMRKLYDSDVTNDYPATLIKTHKNAFLMVDEETNNF